MNRNTFEWQHTQRVTTPFCESALTYRERKSVVGRDQLSFGYFYACSVDADVTPYLIVACLSSDFHLLAQNAFHAYVFKICVPRVGPASRNSRGYPGRSSYRTYELPAGSLTLSLGGFHCLIGLYADRYSPISWNIRW
jgi:hypothetical protein